MSLPNHGESCECARCAYASGHDEGASAAAAEIERLKAENAELSSRLDEQYKARDGSARALAHDTRLLLELRADLSKSTARIDALRAALVKLRDEAPEPGFVSWVNQIIDEALTADSAAAAGRVGEETKECPRRGGSGELDMGESFPRCPDCIPADKAGAP